MLVGAASYTQLRCADVSELVKGFQRATIMLILHVICFQNKTVDSHPTAVCL